MAKRKREWVFTSSRRQAMRKAQQRHKVYVELGKRAYARGVRP